MSNLKEKSGKFELESKQTLKKTLFYRFFLMICVIFVFFSCKKEELSSEKVAVSSKNENKTTQLLNVVTPDEYKTLSVTEKKIADLLNASIAGLKAATINGALESDFAAQVDIYKTNEKHWDNVSIIYTPKDFSNKRIEKKCSICDMWDVKPCLKDIKKTVDANGSVSITVTKKDDCYIIAW